MLRDDRFYSIMSVMQAYYSLCKPKVVLLLLMTAIVGMVLSSDGWVPVSALILGTIGIGLGASSAAVINHIVDNKIDGKMLRTVNRPLVRKTVPIKNAIIFAAVLGVLSMLILALMVNPLTALLTFLGLLGYAYIYTVFLKHTTPQNIVIGGLSGALPPLLGWTSVTNSIEREAVLLVLIIFVWTPAHFWPLAIDRLEEYKNAAVPMLPVTHGIEFTKNYILFYTVILFLVSLIPTYIGMSGLLYLSGAAVLGCWFLHSAIQLKFFPVKGSAMKTFRVSIYYLLCLFILLMVDHYLFS